MVPGMDGMDGTGMDRSSAMMFLVVAVLSFTPPRFRLGPWSF
jgi:hypothetical protein